MAASKAILFEHDTLTIRPEQDQLLENLVHMVDIPIFCLLFLLSFFFFAGCFPTKYGGFIKTLSN